MSYIWRLILLYLKGELTLIYIVINVEYSRSRGAKRPQKPTCIVHINLCHETMKFGVFVAFHICMHIRNEDTSAASAEGRHFENKNGHHLVFIIGNMSGLIMNIWVVFVTFWLECILHLIISSKDRHFEIQNGRRPNLAIQGLQVDICAYFVGFFTICSTHSFIHSRQYVRNTILKSKMAANLNSVLATYRCASVKL